MKFKCYDCGKDMTLKEIEEVERIEDDEEGDIDAEELEFIRNYWTHCSGPPECFHGPDDYANICKECLTRVREEYLEFRCDDPAG